MIGEEYFEEETIDLFENLDQVKSLCEGAKKEDLTCLLEVCQEEKSEYVNYIREKLKGLK